MRLKESVRIAGVQPQVAIGLQIANSVFVEQIGHECFVTSINDSTHGKDSLHYKGLAFDLRLPSRVRWGRDWNGEIEPHDKLVHEQLRAELGQEWDVVLELHQSSPYAWHIHCEYDPK